MRRFFYLMAALACLACASCGGGDGATGFNTPEEALDAYGKALEQGDEAAYRGIMAKDTEAIEGLDAIIALQTDMSPEEAAKVNLKAMAQPQGFGGVPSKRFPAEIDGDKAVIVHLFESASVVDRADKFCKWQFEKSGDKWYLMGSESGEAADLPAKYAWDKNIADVSPEMKDFISGFDGTSEKVEAALAKHAPGVETDMGLYGLEDPAVVAREESDGQVRYTLRTKAGMTTPTFIVSWKDGKIVAIEEKED